ncbi:hypothetical protein TrispH2_006330 [Trichoplax sp. H2]|nr:hypothetical protein TrispH2_006330 [Trichoplax sp. H2]|eukprot:RDD41787.1 hypothetical protein TrispH2_006330 [Trichoplax sp. H2]
MLADGEDAATLGPTPIRQQSLPLQLLSTGHNKMEGKGESSLIVHSLADIYPGSSQAANESYIARHDHG